MNKQTALLLPLLLLSALSIAQVEFGVKAGLTTQSLQDESFNVFNSGDRQDLRFALEDADYGFQFGVLLRIPATSRLTIQPEVTFNSAKNTFRLEDANGGGVREVFEERYNDINVPLLLSYKLLGPLRVNAGPVGHFYLSDAGDLKDEEGIERTFDTFNLGYALGASLDIGPLIIDVRYDGNLGKYGDTLRIDGNDIDIDQSPKRWIGSVALRF